MECLKSDLKPIHTPIKIHAYRLSRSISDWISKEETDLSYRKIFLDTLRSLFSITDYFESQNLEIGIGIKMQQMLNFQIFASQFENNRILNCRCSCPHFYSVGKGDYGTHSPKVSLPKYSSHCSNVARDEFNQQSNTWSHQASIHKLSTQFPSSTNSLSWWTLC